MKKFILIGMCALTLIGCAKKDAEAPESTDAIENQKEMIVGNAFMVTNELSDKKLDVKAFETNLSEKGKFYYQLKITNGSNEAIALSKIQIVLVDSNGKEKKIGLTDFDLDGVLDPESTVEGLIAFDDLDDAIPENLKVATK